MSAGVYNLLIEQAATFTRVFTWYQDDGVTLVNVTGYTAKMKVKSAAATILDSAGAAGVLISLTLGGAAGTITVVITAAVTGALEPTDDYDHLSYDLELTSAAGVVTRLVKGGVKVDRGVTL